MQEVVHLNQNSQASSNGWPCYELPFPRVKQKDSLKKKDVILSTENHVLSAPLTSAAIRPVTFSNTVLAANNVTLLAILALGLQTLNAGHAL